MFIIKAQAKTLINLVIIKSLLKVISTIIRIIPGLQDKQAEGDFPD